jgi:TPR repeat protein
MSSASSRRGVFVALTLVFWVALTSIGCTSYPTAARAQFASSVSCPDEKITVTSRPGDPAPPQNPPPEIASDPGKLAVWRRDDEERRRDAAATVYIVKGCGQEKHYNCGRSDRHAAQTACVEKAVDPAATAPTDDEMKKCAAAPRQPIAPAQQRAPDAKHCTLGSAGDCDSMCKASDAESCAILGKMYGEGISVDVDLDKSKDLLQLACGSGSARGCHSLGVVHDFGHGVATEPATAIPFYDQACTWGYAESCASLAGHYATGNGIKADLKKAADYAKRACAWGSASGCKRLGALYLGGLGLDKDQSCATVTFRKACAGGDPAACDLAHKELAAIPAGK